MTFRNQVYPPRDGSLVYPLGPPRRTQPHPSSMGSGGARFPDHANRTSRYGREPPPGRSRRRPDAQQQGDGPRDIPLDGEEESAGRESERAREAAADPSAGSSERGLRRGESLLTHVAALRRPEL